MFMEIYIGNNIKKVLPKIRLMASTRYDKYIIKDFYYRGMKKLDDEILLLCDDWYLLYKITDTSLVILDWLSIDDNKPFKRMVEMSDIITKLLIKYKNLKVETTFRHYTSYNIYSKLRDLGYLNELDNYLFLDRNIPKNIGNQIDRIIGIEGPDTLIKFMESEDILKYKDYYPYFLHLTEFKVTDKFIKRYSKNR